LIRRSLLPAADYVVIATPLTPETKGLIDEAALCSMRQSAYLINIARRAIVDEAALLTALHEGWIAGAGLDTVATEPLPPESPLWSLPNAFITPHCSALSPRLRERIAQLFIDNLKRYHNWSTLTECCRQASGILIPNLLLILTWIDWIYAFSMI
jgi:phosphoglycerate dehydrogenase-like enzyme